MDGAEGQFDFAIKEANAMLLRGAKPTAVKPEQVKVQRRRLRSVLQDIMYLACKYVQRGRQHFSKFSHACHWLCALEVLYARL